MVKSVLAVNHQGVRDWVIQRISAIIIACWTFGLAGYFICNAQISYLEWRMFFTPAYMKVAFMILVLALSYHAWVGIWIILTDYVKFPLLRFLLQVLIFLTLLAMVLWALLLMWSF